MAEAAWVGQRLRATAVDLVLLQTAAIPGGLLELGVPAVRSLHPALLGELVYLALSAYLLVTTGQTFGKRFHRIRVLDARGDHPGIGRILVRACAAPLVGMLASFVLQWTLDEEGRIDPRHVMWLAVLLDCATIFGRDRRCVHDYLAGTRVVRVSAAEVFA